MKVLFINGSPKGNNSVTLQTAIYIDKTFRNDAFSYYNVGQKIKALENDFSDIEELIKNNELIIFLYPVYTFLVPSQLIRFIELMHEHDIDLDNKYVAQISTSKHFYDVTAANFLKENILDFRGKYIGELCADMEDLLTPLGQKQASDFYKLLMFAVDNEIYVQRKINIVKELPFYNKQLDSTQKDNTKKVVVVANLSKDDLILKNMVDDFVSSSCYPVNVINIREFNFAGGCLGCFNCASTGECIYKDGFSKLLHDEIQKADVIINAFTIQNHYAESHFKMYDDRQFCNGHRQVIKGTPTGYLINGYLSSENNLLEMLKARSEVGGLYLTGIVSSDDQDISKSIVDLNKSIKFAIDNKISMPTNFYGVGGHKIFRDLVYKMQGIMTKDHKFYKETGVYDFPQKEKGRIFAMKLVGKLMKKPKYRAMMNNYILMPYKKVIDNVEIDQRLEDEEKSF